MKTYFLLGALFLFTAKTGLTQNTWTQKNNFGGAARMGAVGFSIGVKGYLGTGSTFNGASYNDFWEYDPATDSWTQKANLPIARYRAVGFATATHGYIATGYGGTYLNDLWEYTPATNVWIQKTSVLAAGMGGLAYFVVGNKAYMGTGYDGAYMTNFWEYNTLTDTWTQKAAFAGQPKIYATGFAIGAKGYLGFGCELNGNIVSTNDFWEYDTTSNGWTQKGNFPGSTRSEAVGFAIGNHGYIGTGSVSWGITALADFWKYNPTTDTWTQVANFGGGLREHAAAFVIDCKAYMGTGFINDDANTLQNDMWEYVDCTVGLEEMNDISFTLYPNPVKENIILKLNAVERNLRVEILNVAGKKVFESALHAGSNKINISNLAGGNYFVKVFGSEKENNNREKEIIQKLVVL